MAIGMFILSGNDKRSIRLYAVNMFNSKSYTNYQRDDY